MHSDFIAGRVTRETSFLPFFTLPLMHDPEITTYRYKGILQEYVMLCYDFLSRYAVTQPHL
jgi:hypothetical protein